MVDISFRMFLESGQNLALETKIVLAPNWGLLGYKMFECDKCGLYCMQVGKLSI